MRDLENTTYKGRMNELGLFCLEKKVLKDDKTAF